MVRSAVLTLRGLYGTECSTYIAVINEEHRHLGSIIFLNASSVPTRSDGNTNY